MAYNRLKAGWRNPWFLLHVDKRQSEFNPPRQKACCLWNTSNESISSSPFFGNTTNHTAPGWLSCRAPKSRDDVSRSANSRHTAPNPAAILVLSMTT